MDKNHFLKLLRHYASTSLEDAKEIYSLKAQFPYSQILQTLGARVSKDHGFQNQQGDLQMAAVYASDRGLLKEIISAVPEEAFVNKLVISKHILAEEQVASTIDSIDVADVIMNDLERLSKLKNTFENLFMDYSKFKNINPAEAEPQVVEQQISGIALPEISKSKKERIIEVAKALGTATPIDSLVIDGMPIPVKGINHNNMEALVGEIQGSKDEIIPDNDKQKHQIEIINQFIRVQPSISSPKDRSPSPMGDLNPVKSGEFSENIVSETLVEILIKQGKKEKAIEVLKKLIWKYPQKKAYFASQIEDLKK